MSNPNWVYDGPTLSTTKVDLNPIGSAPPNEYQQAFEQNLGNQGLDDLRRVFEPIFGFEDQPYAGKILVVPITRAVVLDVNFGAGGSAKSQCFVGVNPSATAIFNVIKQTGGVQTGIGTVSIATTGVVTWTAASATPFAVGDFLIVEAPTPQDVTLANVFMRFCAKK